METVRKSNKGDSWEWGSNQGGVFPVKSTHSMLAKMLLQESDLGTSETYVFQHTWSSSAPSKTTALS